MRFRNLAIVLLVVVQPHLLSAQTSLDSKPELTLDDAVQTLREDFQRPPVWRGGGVQVDEKPKPLTDASFSWAAGYIWNHALVGAPEPWPPPTENFPAWTSNTHAEASPNGDMIAQIGEALSPLTWSGSLNLTARRMPPELAATIGKLDPKDYLSATIVSFPYSQRYGVFAMSAKLPKGNGLWPAFWLLPADRSWPPEIDIMEVLGRDTKTLYTTLHKVGAPAAGIGTDTVTDLSEDFHEYAVDWGPEKIDWYFDRKLIFSQPTPAELNKPCYIIANLGVGFPKSWGGAPDETTKFPATMTIAYIRVWQRQRYTQIQGMNKQQ